MSDERAGVALTNLDQPLFPDAGATKRDLVDYLDGLGERFLGPVRDRPMSVVRALRGQRPFMQKNLPKYAPDWIRRATVWAQSSQREVAYPLCDDRPTLLWLANQRAVEYHPTLVRSGDAGRPTHLVLDIDPPEGAPFAVAAGAAHLVRQALADAGLRGAVKTSGAKGVHIFVPVEPSPDGAAAGERAFGEGQAPDARWAFLDDVAAATRALAVRAERIDPDLATTAFIVADRGGKVFLDSTRAGGATVVAPYSPRLRPGAPVSFPLDWSDLDSVTPQDFPLRTALDQLAGKDPWSDLQPPPQQLPADLIAEGHTIPVARVQAMHEGKRRAATRRNPHS